MSNDDVTIDITKCEFNNEPTVYKAEDMHIHGEHDCWDYSTYYEFYDNYEGKRHRFHGYECSLCGNHLECG